MRFFASGGDIFCTKKAAVALLGLIASPVAAAQCAFDRECIVGESCEQSSFDVTVTASPSQGRATLGTIYGDIQGLYSNSSGEAPYNVTAFLPETGDSYHLTWDDTAAWLTLHFPSAEMAMTYVGTCGVLE